MKFDNLHSIIVLNVSSSMQITWFPVSRQVIDDFYCCAAGETIVHVLLPPQENTSPTDAPQDLMYAVTCATVPQTTRHQLSMNSLVEPSPHTHPDTLTVLIVPDGSGAPA